MKNDFSDFLTHTDLSNLERIEYVINVINNVIDDYEDKLFQRKLDPNIKMHYDIQIRYWEGIRRGLKVSLNIIKRRDTFDNIDLR
jgi:hypothetical protein